MFRKLMTTTAAAALLALGAGAVQTERIVLKPGLHTGHTPAAQQDRREPQRYGHRDRRRHGDRHGFHFRAHPHGYSPWRFYSGHRPDVGWRHRGHSYGHFGMPRHFHRSRYGFYFPGYGLIHYGHRHTRFCPDWHFDVFIAGRDGR